MGPEKSFVLKFCHGVPVPLWHIPHPALGIIPLFDGDGIVKTLPKDPVRRFCVIRRSHLKILQRTDHGFSGGVKQGFLVGAVINEKTVIHVPGAEMAAKDR